jgi:hypothetical protein
MRQGPSQVSTFQNIHRQHHHTGGVPSVGRPISLPSLRKERQNTSYNPYQHHHTMSSTGPGNTMEDGSLQKNDDRNNSFTSTGPGPFSYSSSAKLSMASFSSVVQNSRSINPQSSWSTPASPKSPDDSSFPLEKQDKKPQEPEALISKDSIESISTPTINAARKSSISLNQHSLLLSATVLKTCGTADWLEEENQEMDFSKELVFPSTVAHQQIMPTPLLQSEEPSALLQDQKTPAHRVVDQKQSQPNVSAEPSDSSPMKYGKISILKHSSPKISNPDLLVQTPNQKSQFCDSIRKELSIRIPLQTLRLTKIPKRSSSSLIRLSMDILKNTKQNSATEYIVPLPLHILKHTHLFLSKQQHSANNSTSIQRIILPVHDFSRINKI